MRSHDPESREFAAGRDSGWRAGTCRGPRGRRVPARGMCVAGRRGSCGGPRWGGRDVGRLPPCECVRDAPVDSRCHRLGGSPPGPREFTRRPRGARTRRAGSRGLASAAARRRLEPLRSEQAPGRAHPPPRSRLGTDRHCRDPAGSGARTPRPLDDTVAAPQALATCPAAGGQRKKRHSVRVRRGPGRRDHACRGPGRRGLGCLRHRGRPRDVPA
jgi:hypothetical protein